MYNVYIQRREWSEVEWWSRGGGEEEEEERQEQLLAYEIVKNVRIFKKIWL